MTTAEPPETVSATPARTAAQGAPPSPPELPVPPLIPPSVETMEFREKPSARVVVETEDLETAHQERTVTFR
jgi:hypothetical protein